MLKNTYKFTLVQTITFPDQHVCITLLLKAIALLDQNVYIDKWGKTLLENMLKTVAFLHQHFHIYNSV